MINVESLPDLAKFYAGEISVDASTSSLFYSFGFLRLLELDNSKLGAFGGGSTEFQKTELGQKYVRLALARTASRMQACAPVARQSSPFSSGS